MIGPYPRGRTPSPDDVSPTLVARQPIAGLPGVSFVTIACHKPAGGWAVPHYTNPDEFGWRFVRRGGFTRRADGKTAYVDPTIAYINLPGTVQEIGHPVDGGDDCTIIALPEDQVVGLAGDGVFPSTVMQTVPAIDIELRELAIRLRSGADCFEFQERLAHMIGTLVESAWPGRLTTERRPKTTAQAG